MLKLNRRSMLSASAVSAVAFAVPNASKAQTSSYGPNDLKGVLTPFGAERAGNAEGTIPAWTGELIPLPADYVSGTPRPDPFPNEKPLFTITAANMTQYQDKLAAGAVQLLSRYADFRMDVYPTHRTAIAPQYVYDYTYKNATNATIAADGNSISNAYGGIPFPIPTNGKQAIWNHELGWKGVSINNPASAYTITTSGEAILRSGNNIKIQFPYYFEGEEANFDGIYEQFLLSVLAPPYQEGQGDLLLQPLNPSQTPPRAWAYLPGQRRTRLAPQLEYDTPVDIAGAVLNWDETQMYYGPLDEYDCKLVGKKEMYIPYNMNKAWITTPLTAQFGPHFYDPDITRWELHRVWVVEMTLAPGKRNVDARRVVYLDEDTWFAFAIDTYDASGALWKFQHVIPALCSDIPCQLAAEEEVAYDFHAGDYAMLSVMSEQTQWQPIDRIPTSFFTAGQLAALAGGN